MNAHSSAFLFTVVSVLKEVNVEDKYPWDFLKLQRI